jgi:F0F1-type ATP synthase alpha subunit
MTSIQLERTLHDYLMMQNTSALTMSRNHETCSQMKSGKTLFKYLSQMPIKIASNIYLNLNTSTKELALIIQDSIDIMKLGCITREFKYK